MTYMFDSADKQPRSLPLDEALASMLQGQGLYLKFNRDLTNNEPAFAGAVRRPRPCCLSTADPVLSPHRRRGQGDGCVAPSGWPSRGGRHLRQREGES